MTTHLLSSFSAHIGERGCHFYDDEDCTFLGWQDVFSFLGHLPSEDRMNPFADKLTTTLANYDPNKEYLAVQQVGGRVSVELYRGAAG